MLSKCQAHFRLAHSSEVQDIFLGRPADIGLLLSVGDDPNTNPLISLEDCRERCMF